MHQRYEDGVNMESIVQIEEENRTGVPFFTRLFQFLVIAIGSWSGIAMLVECIGIPCDMLRINGMMLIYSAAIFGLCLIPAYELVKLFFGILTYGLFFYSRLDRIANGFYLTENLLFELISNYYETPRLRFLADMTTARADTTLLVIMISLPFSTLLAIAVVRNRLVRIGGLIMLLPVSACFLLGMIPSERYLVPYVVCLLYLGRSGVRHRSHQIHRSLFHRVSSRTAGWLSILCITIFFLMRLLVSREQYNEVTGIRELKSKIQTAMNRVSLADLEDRFNRFRAERRQISSTGLSGGELSKTGEVRYENVKHLRVIAPSESVAEGIYLRGYVGSFYTGDRWESHSEEMRQEYERLAEEFNEELFYPMNQMSLFLKRFQTEMTWQGDQGQNPGGAEYSLSRSGMVIDYRGADRKYLYAPYFMDYDVMKDIRYEQDLYAAPSNRAEHWEYRYYYGISFLNKYAESMRLGDWADSYMAYEKRYRDYVYRAYTILPEEGVERIKQDFSSEQAEAAGAGSIAEKIEYVRKYLAGNTSYSLAPGVLPEGKDYVEYFLYENKTGYCVHYASAAVLMLRAMGIPARYAEGYAFGQEAVVQSSGHQEVTRYTGLGKLSMELQQSVADVMDYHAHAWAEVYYDNCGWIPVEFTPGASVSYNTTLAMEMEKISEGIEDGEETEPEATPSPSPAPTPAPTSTPRPTRSLTPTSGAPRPTLPAKADQGSSGAAKENVPEKGDHLYLWSLLGIVCLAMISVSLYRVGQRSRARSTRNVNQQVLFLFGDIQKILRAGRSLPGKNALLEESEAYIREQGGHLDGQELERLMEIVRKARFGRGRIATEELKWVRSCRNRLYVQVNREISLPRKIYLKINLL